MFEKMNYESFYKQFEKITQNDFTNHLSKFIKDKNINVFDVGCYKGTFVKNIIKNLKNKKINFFLFDPNPNLVINNYQINKVGISNRNGKEFFFLNTVLPHSGSSINTIIKDDKLWNLTRSAFFLKKKKYEKTLIDVQKLDTYCKKNKIKKIDILKIDTEGNEFKVLQGSKNILKHTNIIIIEVLDTKKNYYMKFERINRLLTNLGFELIMNKGINSVSLFSNLKGSDNLYVRKV